MLRNVAVVVVNGFLPFEFGTICEVFGVDRADDGLPSYDFAVVAGEPAPLRAHNDFTIQPPCGRTGFGNATALRHHFRAWRGTTPNAYRRLFRGDPSSHQLK
jgi:transcriptional regulator GlxA family with amidase domain